MGTRNHYLSLVATLGLSMLLTACGGAVSGPIQAAQSAATPIPHNEQGSMSDGTAVIETDVGPRHTIDTGPLLLHAPQSWNPHLVITKCAFSLTEAQVCSPDQAYEISESAGNLLTTNGANQLWTGLSTAIATPWNTTNTMLAVGDSTTAAAVGQTDLQAALGTKLNAADCSAATNATPIVLTCSFSPTPVVGQVVAISGFTGAGASAVNQTFELSAASASSVTLLNSAGSGAITLAGGVVQPVNKYRQLANAAGSAVVSTNSITYVATVGTTNANYTWQEWGMTTGGAVTNKQAAPPPFLLNRAVTNLGTKTSASSWTATLTLSLS